MEIRELIDTICKQFISGSALFLINQRYVCIETYDNDGVGDVMVTDGETGEIIMKTSYGEWLVNDDWVNNEYKEGL